MKTYKFSYGSKLKKFISKFIIVISNLFLFSIFLLLFLYIFTSVNYKLKTININDEIILIIKWIEIVMCLFVFLLLVFQSFLPQKVEVYSTSIKVYRRSCSGFLRGFSDTILIDNIEKICIEDNRKLSHLPKIMPAFIVDWENLVRIETTTGHLIYYVQIENANDFIAHIKLLMEEHKK